MCSWIKTVGYDCSTSASPDGDLDYVIAKVLREEPGERYTGAGELAADVRAYLAGRAVSAHPESLRYRVTKFVSRNRTTAFAISASAVLLSAYAVTATVQGRRSAAARDAATREAQKAAEVSEFMVLLFQSADPDLRAGAPVSASELLSIDARQRQEDPMRDPLARAAMHSAIGRSFEAVGAYREAEEQLEAALLSYGASERTCRAPMMWRSTGRGCFNSGEQRASEVRASVYGVSSARCASTPFIHTATHLP